MKKINIKTLAGNSIVRTVLLLAVITVIFIGIFTLDRMSTMPDKAQERHIDYSETTKKASNSKENPTESPSGSIQLEIQDAESKEIPETKTDSYNHFAEVNDIEDNILEPIPPMSVSQTNEEASPTLESRMDSQGNIEIKRLDSIAQQSIYQDNDISVETLFGDIVNYQDNNSREDNSSSVQNTNARRNTYSKDKSSKNGTTSRKPKSSSSTEDESAMLDIRLPEDIQESIHTEQDNKLYKCTFLGSSSLCSGEKVSIKVLEDIPIDTLTTIEKGSVLYGICSVSARVGIEVKTFQKDEDIHPLRMKAYGVDLEEGLWYDQGSKSSSPKRALSQNGLPAGISYIFPKLSKGARDAASVGIEIVRNSNRGEKVYVNVPSGYVFFLKKDYSSIHK